MTSDHYTCTDHKVPTLTGRYAPGVQVKYIYTSKIQTYKDFS